MTAAKPIGLAILAEFVLLAGPIAHAQDIVTEGAQVRRLSDGFVFTEGPAADEQGNVYFSDVRTSKIYVWSLDGTLKTFREDTGGGNGLFFDKQDNLFICEGGNRQIGKVSASGEYSVVASKYDGKRLNRPNDLWVDPQGGIYFSDPAGRRMQEPREQDGSHIYYISPQDRKVIRVTQDVQQPNGLIGTADGKLLYATDRQAGKVFVWDIHSDGTLANKRFFCAGGSDGMTLDERGNVYITTDVVEVFSPDGKPVKKIELPERPSNVCFGGKDRKTLFITARTGLYALDMTVKGQY